MIDYYDFDSKPISVEEWGELYKSDERFLANDEAVTADGEVLRVSTVWLGLNHNLGEGPPLIFETMVFPKGSHEERECFRYSTRQEALDSHERICLAIENGQMLTDNEG